MLKKRRGESSDYKSSRGGEKSRKFEGSDEGPWRELLSKKISPMSTKFIINKISFLAAWTMERKLVRLISGQYKEVPILV